MFQERIQGFVDGGYFRAKATPTEPGKHLNPYSIVLHTIRLAGFANDRPFILSRVSYYDAQPDEGEELSDADKHLAKYFDAVESIEDTECRFGYLRGKPESKPRRQKGVDVQLAVDMLGRAADGICDVAVLIAGDADFVPVVHETRRRGVLVIVGGFPGTVSELLTREADRFVKFPPEFNKIMLQF